MKLACYEMRNLREGMSYSKTENLKLIEQFVDSGLKSSVVEEYPHRTPQSCAASLNNSAKRYHYYSVKAKVQGNEVVLINTSI